MAFSVPINGPDARQGIGTQHRAGAACALALSAFVGVIDTSYDSLRVPTVHRVFRQSRVPLRAGLRRSAWRQKKEIGRRRSSPYEADVKKMMQEIAAEFEQRGLRTSRLCVAIACAVVAACGPSSANSTSHSGTAAVANGLASAVEQGAFALIVRGDTTVREEYTRTEAALRGEIHPGLRGANFGWAKYEVEFATGNFVKRARVYLGPVDASATARSWEFTLREGRVTEVRPDRREMGLDAGADVIPVFAPSMVMFHEVIRRALPLRHSSGSARIPVFHFPGNTGRVDTVTVTWASGDTASVSYGGRATHFGVDKDGRILGSRPDDFTYVRTR